MKALVYHGPGNKAWEDVPDAAIVDDTDVVVRVEATTICGTGCRDRSRRSAGDLRACGVTHPSWWTRCQHRCARRPSDPALEDLWSRNVTITTGLVDAFSTPTLLKLVGSGQLDAGKLVTHRFSLDEFERAYELFANAADTGALKVILTRL